MAVIGVCATWTKLERRWARPWVVRSWYDVCHSMSTLEIVHTLSTYNTTIRLSTTISDRQGWKSKRVTSHDCVLTQSHESERDSSICASLSLLWFCVWRCIKTIYVRVPSHVSGMRCVFAQNHVSEGAVPCIRNALRFCAKPWEWERCTNITISLTSHTTFCVLTQRQTQNHESERDAQILLSLSLSWLCVQRCVKTQWSDATLDPLIASYSKIVVYETKKTTREYRFYTTRIFSYTKTHRVNSRIAPLRETMRVRETH